MSTDHKSDLFPAFEYGQTSEDGHLKGFGIRISPNGNIHEGMFDRKLDGYGRIIHPNGDYYLGYWKAGQKHGRGRYVFADNEIRVGNWELGKNVDIFQITHPDGKKSLVKF